MMQLPNFQCKSIPYLLLQNTICAIKQINFLVRLYICILGLLVLYRALICYMYICYDRAIVLVLLWSNEWLLLLPLISLAYRVVKKFVKWLWMAACGYKEKMYSREELEPIRVWCMQRLDVIVPSPVRGMTRFMQKGDTRVCALGCEVNNDNINDWHI